MKAETAIHIQPVNYCINSKYLNLFFPKNGLIYFVILRKQNISQDSEIICLTNYGEFKNECQVHLNDVD